MKFIVIAILVSLLAISAVSANDLNATDSVVSEVAIDDNLDVSNDDLVSTTHTVNGNTFADIQNVINMANEGDTVSLSGLYSGNGNGVKINKKLIIEGNGAILDAHTKSEIFEITGKNVVVNNVTCINGFNSCGGGIDWWTGIYGDTSHYDGLLTNSRFINCKADYAGYGGAVYFFANGLTMKNCYFEGNLAKKGGAVYVAGNGSTIENCTFFNNFYWNSSWDVVSGYYEGVALMVNFKEDDIFTEWSENTNIKNCKFINDTSVVNYLLSSYRENEEFSGTESYIVPKYKTSGNVVKGKTFKDIQNAIFNARPGDVIELSGTYTGDGNPIEVHKAVTIVGVGQTVLDAKGLSPIFKIAHIGVSLFNLKLTNGYSSQHDFLDNIFAGAINSYKNNLYIGNTVFENNNGYMIAAVHSVGDNAVLNNCTFINNKVGITQETRIELIGFDDCGNSQNNIYTYQSSSIVRLGGQNSFLDNAVFSNNNQASKDFSIKTPKSDDGTVILTVPSLRKNYGDSKQLELTLTEGGKPISNAGISIQIGHDITKTVYTNANGHVSVDLNDLKIGTYMIISRYNDVFKVSVVVVDPYTSHIEIKTPDIVGYYGGTQKVTTTLTKDSKVLSNVNVKITVNGKTSTVKTDSKGQASINLNLPVGTHDVITEYDNVKVTSKVTIKSTVNIADVSGTYSNTKSTATFLNTDGKALSSKQVTFKVGDKTYAATTNSNGIATANVDLGVGTYTLTAVNPTTKEEKSVKLTISKADSTVVLSVIQNGKSVTLTATVTPSGATGKITFAVIPTVVYDSGIIQFLPEKRKDYQSNIVNGKAVFTIPDLAIGSYSAFAIYDGDSNLMPFESDFTDFKVNKVYSIINAGDTKGTYLDSKVSATFLDANSKVLSNTKVIFRAGGKTYSATTNSNGEATAKVDLDAGTYDVTAVNPNTNEEKQFRLTINKANPEFTLKASKSNGIKANGIGMVAITATFTQNMVTGMISVSSGDSTSYSGTIADGKAIINTLYSQNVAYDVTVKYKGDKNFNAAEKKFSFKVSDVKPVLSSKSISLVYGNAKNLIINLNDEDGTPIPDKIIHIKINGNKYGYDTIEKYTNNNGQVIINTKGIIPDNYNVDINSEDCKKITVKLTVKKATPKLTAKAKTFKKSVKTKKYTVTLKTNQNKVMKNTKVTLKVNGKTYSAKTNSKGVATFKITKLTKKGKFTATIKYAGSKYYNAKNVKTKITVK